MLEITVEAGMVLKATLDATGDAAGALRISTGPTRGSSDDVRALRLDVVDHGGDDDKLLTAPGGASVLLDPAVVPLLDHKTLDATVDDQGRSSFVLVNS